MCAYEDLCIEQDQREAPNREPPWIDVVEVTPATCKRTEGLRCVVSALSILKPLLGSPRGGAVCCGDGKPDRRILSESVYLRLNTQSLRRIRSKGD